MNKNKQGARGPDPKSPHGHAEEKKAKSKALEAKKGQCAKCGKDHPTTGHSAATIYHTPTPGLEEWRKKNHPFKK